MIITDIRQELKNKIDSEYKEREGSFSKEEYQSYGVRTPKVRETAKKFWKQVKSEQKSEIFAKCQQLLESEMSEEQTVAFSWAYRLKSRLTPDDLDVFYQWLKTYVDTWFKCDDFCSHAVGYLLYKYPQFSTEVLEWAGSDNRWLRRAAAVSLLYSLRREEQLDLAFRVADKLLLDEDDLVQKGYGWMLKEATKHWPNQVFQFVLERKDRMPRTALRYAIEKLPDDQRQQAMS